MTKNADDLTTIETLAERLDLSSWNDLSERNFDYFDDAGQEARKEAIAEGKSEDAAEKALDKARNESELELYNRWYDAVEKAADYVFRAHGMGLSPAGRSKGPRPHELKIVPLKSWTDAASKVLDTVNGLGYFEFKNLKAFADSGPYTHKELAIGHFSSIKRRGEVYGDDSPKDVYHRAMR